MSAYYNENDRFAAQWLRELIKAGLIADGEVDERDIRDVRANDLRGFTQCHFFAGIGGWSVALRLAGWDDNAHVWTGSCPCQPFSAAGAGLSTDDPRHLWPEWYRLIRFCLPAVVFGEQVASADGLAWFDLVSSQMENAGYAIGAADIGASGVGAPHLRQRLWFVADADGGLSSAERIQRRGEYRQRTEDSRARALEYTEGPKREWWPETDRSKNGFPNPSPWSSYDVTYCTDGKRRPFEPGSFPVADGVPGRLGLIRGYGNAIVPQVAATFIEAYLSVIETADHSSMEPATWIRSAAPK